MTAASVSAFIKSNKLPDAYIETIEQHFIPLAQDIATNQQETKATSPYFIGINGCQGSGKSTLSEFLALYIKEQYGLSVAVLSLDDFYYSQQQRNNLANKVHSLLATRGVPGTHDTVQMLDVFQQLSQQPINDLAIPRFDKANDDPFDQSQWPVINDAVDIVIVEGWCWGVSSQEIQLLTTPVNKLEQDQDTDGVWRHYVNQKLALDYEPLYQWMDYWVMLKAPSFECVYQWRLEQEQKLAAKQSSDGAKSVMSAPQVMAFIQYYQRLTEHGLKTLPANCDRVFHLDAARQIISVN